MRVAAYVRHQLPSILRIERASFEDAWSESSFLALLREPQVQMLVAEYGGQVEGYLLMHRWPREVVIANVAVEPEFRRRGIGRQLVAAATAWLQCERELLRAAVRETNVTAQLFFRSVGFWANGHDGCPAVADPSYNFEFRRGDGRDVLRSLLEGDGRVIRS